MLSGRMDVAIDVHPVPRWDARKIGGPVRSKMKSGTTCLV